VNRESWLKAYGSRIHDSRFTIHDYLLRFLPPELFFRAPPFFPVRFLGTLPPFERASDNPIAIACLRLFTFPPLPPGPERSVPFLRRRIALATRLPAAFP
jgi:hypothetical protein